MRYRTGYYKASVVHGVYFYGPELDKPNVPTEHPIIFMEYIQILDPDEEITAFFDESSFHILAEIDELYGIK